MRDEILELVWALAAICAVLLLSYWFTGEQICLLGAAPGGITCLRTLNREEMGQWEQEGAPEGACQRISFQEALKSVLQQRRK